MLRLPRHPAEAPRYAALCDPGTALLLAAGASALGTVTSAVGAINQGYATQEAEQYNATLAQQQAQTAIQTSQEQAQQVQYQTHQTVGQQVANAGASGVDPNQGSPLSVMSDTATQGELNRQLTLWQGQSQAVSLQNQAAQDIYAGNQAVNAGYANAFGTFLSGVGRTVGLYTQYATLPTLGASGGKGGYVPAS